MLSFIKFLFLSLFLIHGTIIIVKLIKKQQLRPRAYVILIGYLFVTGCFFYGSSKSVLLKKRDALVLENQQLETRRIQTNKDLYIEYADTDIDAYIYLSDYYKTQFDAQIYHNNLDIAKIDNYLK